jgi:hypothetical protein
VLNAESQIIQNENHANIGDENNHDILISDPQDNNGYQNMVQSFQYSLNSAVALIKE